MMLVVVGILDRETETRILFWNLHSVGTMFWNLHSREDRETDVLKFALRRDNVLKFALHEMTLNLTEVLLALILYK